jgi:mannose-6-phosphate isomerase-like protein (cupin superfamily)
MNVISRQSFARKVVVSKTMTAYEYPTQDPILNGAVVELTGRYPRKGRVVNEKVTELCFVLKGKGELIIEGEEIEFNEGDQLLIKPGQRYYWNAVATAYMSCTPAWYPDQHKEVE